MSENNSPSAKDAPGAPGAPVGASARLPVVTGRPGQPWVIVLGNEASFRFFARPTLGGVAFSLPAIDVMTFDDDARITSQRAFVDFAMLAPAED